MTHEGERVRGAEVAPLLHGMRRVGALAGLAALPLDGVRRGHGIPAVMSTHWVSVEAAGVSRRPRYPVRASLLRRTACRSIMPFPPHTPRGVVSMCSLIPVVSLCLLVVMCVGLVRPGQRRVLVLTLVLTLLLLLLLLLVLMPDADARC